MKRLILIAFTAASVSIFGCQNINGQNKTSANQPKRKIVKSNTEWKKELSPTAYNIMVERGTEEPFHNAYYNNHEKGTYLSAATGEPLFSSGDKFESGTGWPSFVKPIDPSKIEIVHDSSYGMDRDEVIEKSTGFHLGHVFDDGPADRGGKRYCMNSGAFKFVKK